MYGYNPRYKAVLEAAGRGSTTKKVLFLRPLEYIAVKKNNLIPEIGGALPELDRVVSCYVQSDHMN